MTIEKIGVQQISKVVKSNKQTVAKKIQQPKFVLPKALSKDTVTLTKDNKVQTPIARTCGAQFANRDCGIWL